MFDRVSGGLAAVVKALIPGIDYYGWYRARVVRQTLAASGKMTVDVTPDDKRIPPMSGIPLKLGLPAARVQISPGAFVVVGWEGGDPQKPQAALWDGGEADALKMVLGAQALFLGAEVGAEPPQLGITYGAAESTANNALAAAATGLAAACAGPLAPLAAGFTAMAAAWQQMEAARPTFLAKRTKVA